MASRWLMLIAFFVPVALAQSPTLAPPEIRSEPERHVVVTIANPQSTRPGAVGGTAHGYGPSRGYRVSASAAAVVKELSRAYTLTPVAEWPIEALEVHCIVFRIPASATRDEVLRVLREDRRVLIAQALNEFTPSTASYDDPYAKLQENVRALAVLDAHRMSRGKGVRVAVIDTGIDTRHPDLAGRVELIRNYVDEDLAAFRADRHGTQVAGLIAAAANNGIGIVGIAPDVKLLALKACWQESGRAAGRCNSFTLAQALAGAISLNAHVINLSLVGPADPLLAALVGKARASGAIVVGAAAGELSKEGFPAGVEGVLAVTEAEGNLADSHLVRAPGRDLVTLMPAGHYDFASGSSLATAQITGIVALLLQKNRKLGDAELRRILQSSTSEHRTEHGTITVVNACMALAQVVQDAACAAPSGT